MPTQHRLWLHDLDHPQQVRPQLGHQHEKYAVAVPEPERRLCPSQSDIELMPKKQILSFERPARLEQIGDQPAEHTEDSNHR